MREEEVGGRWRRRAVRPSHHASISTPQSAAQRSRYGAASKRANGAAPPLSCPPPLAELIGARRRLHPLIVHTLERVGLIPQAASPIDGTVVVQNHPIHGLGGGRCRMGDDSDTTPTTTLARQPPEALAALLHDAAAATCMPAGLGLPENVACVSETRAAIDDPCARARRELCSGGGRTRDSTSRGPSFGSG